MPILVLLGVAAYKDFKEGIIPNILPVSIFAYSFLLGVLGYLPLLKNLLTTTVVFTALFFFYNTMNKKYGGNALGGGDVKIFTALTMYYGSNILPIMLVSGLTSSIYGLIKGIKNKTYLRTAVRFVPFIFIAAMVCAVMFPQTFLL